MANATESSQETSTQACHVNIGGMRSEYRARSDCFTEDSLSHKEPFGLFKTWFEIASNTPEVGEADAMFLATATKDGIPSLRPLQLKGFGTDGLKFHSNYGSRKAQELDENPNAAVAFLWQPLRRVVRIEGTVEKTSPEDSDNCFKTRPYHGQIIANLSKQSSVIPNREFLTEKEKDLQEQYPDEVPRPAWWGGYKLVPKSFEFWQGQSDRLHDRIRFRKLKAGETPDNHLVHEGEDGWVYERLSP